MSSSAIEKPRNGVIWLAAGIGLLLLAYGGISLSIGAGVDDILEKARARFPGSGPEALIGMAVSVDVPLEERNRAIWALGQLGEAAAVAPLESLLTGKPCDHDVAVCQRELEKSIRRCRGGVNITRWGWRKFVL